MKVEIYSDIACPWCYIGKRRFDRALAAFEGAPCFEELLEEGASEPVK